MKGKHIRVKQVDVFTKAPFSGSPAIVVTEADNLTDDDMLLITRETNVGEAAFVLVPEGPEADFRLRFFTPLMETEFCSHAAIAAFHALVEDGRIWPGKSRINIFQQTKAGVLPVELHFDNGRLKSIMMTLALPRFEEVQIASDKLEGILNSERNDIIDFRLPVELAYTGQWHMIIPIKNMEAFAFIKPDAGRLKEIISETGAAGIHLFCLDTLEKESIVHTRNYSPLSGVNENPVNGAANGALGCYLIKNSVIKVSTGKVLLVAEQGFEVGRPGKVNIEITLIKKQVTAVRVGGTAVTVINGTMRF